MSAPRLLNLLSPLALQALESEKWTLEAHGDVYSRAAEARIAGWEIFPLAAEFLNLLDGFGSDADDEIYIGAWFNLGSPESRSLRSALRNQNCFPIGMSAGWVNLLLRDDGIVLLSINGALYDYCSSSTESLERLIVNIASSRKNDRLEINNDS